VPYLSAFMMRLPHKEVLYEVFYIFTFYPDIPVFRCKRGCAKFPYKTSLYERINRAAGALEFHSADERWFRIRLFVKSWLAVSHFCPPPDCSDKHRRVLSSCRYHPASCFAVLRRKWSSSHHITSHHITLRKQMQALTGLCI